MRDPFVPSYGDPSHCYCGKASENPFIANLQEARRLLLAGQADAASSGFSVGYENPSQFSREYTRMFGQPPLCDAVRLRSIRPLLDIPQQGIGEVRTLSISYVLGFLAVLSVVHTERGGSARVISFRRASRIEREVYDAWLEKECDES